MEGCINFIARNGDLANLTGSDMKVVFSDHPDRTVAIVAGKNEIFGSRAEAFTAAFGVAGASAHLIDDNTLIWQGARTSPMCASTTQSQAPSPQTARVYSISPTSS